MNELIAKLYDQAIVIENGGDYVAGELDPEKFAELIVRECASFIDSKLEMTEYSHEVLSWADGNDLKQYFGVES